MILVCGPTGSGKSTTLYASLKEIARPDRKLLTVEDPIEYQNAGYYPGPGQHRTPRRREEGHLLQGAKRVSAPGPGRDSGG